MCWRVGGDGDIWVYLWEESQILARRLVGRYAGIYLSLRDGDVINFQEIHKMDT